MPTLFSPRFYAASREYALAFEAFLEPKDLELIAIAYRIASYVHHGKTRCDKCTPYLHHVLAVTDIRVNELGLRWMPKDNRVRAIVSYILHDAREERPDLVTSYFVTQIFGEEVEYSLSLVTKDSGYDRELYYRALRVCQDFETVLLKLCDNLHNSRTLGLCPEHFQLRQIRETDLHYLPLARHLIDILPAEQNWIGNYLLESLEAVCRSYKREFGPHVFPEVG